MFTVRLSIETGLAHPSWRFWRRPGGWQAVPVVHGKRRAGDPAILVSDAGLARERLNWRAKIPARRYAGDGLVLASAKQASAIQRWNAWSPPSIELYFLRDSRNCPRGGRIGMGAV